MKRVTINGKPYTVEREHGGQAYVVPVLERPTMLEAVGRWVALDEIERQIEVKKP